MTRHLVLDSSPLGAISLPAKNPDIAAITQWSRSCLAAGHRIYIPEEIDYELRRELLRAGKVNSIVALDNLKSVFEYLPITTDTMLLAAELWARSRRSGFSTGDPKKLDIDVILAAQAMSLPTPADNITVVTSNVSHLSRFVSADLWSNIIP